MPPKTSQVYRRLLREGWSDTGLGKGSHRTLVKNNVTITLPFHAKELTKGMWESVRKKAGWR